VESVTRIRDRKSVAFACVWISAINTTVAVALSPALPGMAAELGAGGHGQFLAQMIQTLPAIGMIIGAALAGYFSERFGRRAVMVSTVGLFTLSGAACFMAPNLTTLLISRALQGVLAGIMLTTSYAVVAEYFSGSARLRMLGFCGGAGAFSSILILFIAGRMVDSFGWRSVFLLFLPGAVAMPFAFFGMHAGLPQQGERVQLSWRPILALWRVWILQIGFTIGMYMSVIQVPFLATAKGVVSASTISMLVAATSVAATLVAVFHGAIRRVLNVQGMFVLMSLAFGAGLVICGIANGLPLFLFGAAVLGIGAGSVEPTVMSRAFSETPELLHDRVAGAAIAALFAGQFLNPIVVHPVAVFGGIDFAARTFGIIYLIAAMLFLGGRFIPSRRRAVA
jgi:MFS family permease